MNIYLNSIHGIPDAIVSMYMSKRSWTRELENHIREVCDNVLDSRGFLKPSVKELKDLEEFTKWMNTLMKWGWRHTTMLRFIDISVTVEGLHRGGQDDWDSHAKRFDNRIIRSSTRLADFGEGEKSTFYEDKILTTDEALNILGFNAPDTVIVDGKTYVKAVNGYILEEYKDNKDVKRGLYMLSIPSNFIFKINLCEYAHVYKERNHNSTANPEVKLVADIIASSLQNQHSQITPELLLKIKN